MVLVVAAIVLVGLAGPAWIAPADPGTDRAPGVPPAVDPTALPSRAEADQMPYLVNNAVTRQTGALLQRTVCVGRVPAANLDREAEPPGQRRLRVRAAHQFATGAGQVVAVIDSGVSPHPRLVDRLRDGGDYLEGRDGLTDCDGHGTAVAGLIAAAPEPGTGFVGMAPEAEILSIRQGSAFHAVPLLEVTTGEQFRNDVAGDTVSMARAVVRAVNLGATVINISEAACFPAKPNQVNAPDLQAAVRHAVERDVVVVVAAANVGGQCEQNSPGTVTTISSPGWFDGDVLTVAATDDNDEPAEFSIRGPWVDVAAPGVGAVSLEPGGGLTNQLVDVTGNPIPISGTSFATAHVAGLAALVRERYPHLNAREVMDRITRTAQSSAGPGGRSEAAGYGMIDPVAALTTVLPEEHDPQARTGEPIPGAVDFQLPPPADPLARHVALIGSGAALGLLGVTVLVVYTLTWKRRQRSSG